MKAHVQFFHDSTGWNGKDYSGPVKLIEACGSDSVAILDGRFGLARQHEEARRILALRPKYKAYQLRVGSSFLYSRNTSEVILR